jgi:putative SOS response-associated peptidase YedK
LLRKESSATIRIRDDHDHRDASTSIAASRRRAAISFNQHCCIAPPSGYYEWLKRPDGKQPYFMSAADRAGSELRGLWDRWKNKETNEVVISCTVIVTGANALTGTIYKRMLATLDNADVESWLKGTGGAELLRPASRDRLRMWPVSRRVNKAGDDDPTLNDEVAAYGQAPASL